MSEKKTEHRECEKHGRYEAGEMKIALIGKRMWSSCPECNKALIKENERKEQAQRQTYFDKRLKDAGVPPRYFSKTFETFKCQTEGQKKAYEECQRFANGFDELQKTGKSLLLCGGVGTGKTHLSIALIIELTKLHGRFKGRYSSTMRMIREIRDNGFIVMLGAYADTLFLGMKTSIFGRSVGPWKRYPVEKPSSIQVFAMTLQTLSDVLNSHVTGWPSTC